MPARKGGHEFFAEIGKTGVDKRCDERYNLSCVCGRSSSGRARPCQGRGSEFEPRRPLQKETPSVRMVFSFWSGRFCCAKSVACGRVIEREWGNPQRFPPHTPPSLRYARVRTTKPEGNHKKKNQPLGGFSFWNAAGRVELAASTSAKRGEPLRRGRRPRRPVSAAVPRWERIPTSLRAAKQVPLGYSSE